MPRAKRARVSEPEPIPETGAEGTTSSATAADHDSGQAKRAPARRNVRGRRGGLKDMPNMPLDILIEVRFRYPLSLPPSGGGMGGTERRGANSVSMMNVCYGTAAADLRTHASARPPQPRTHDQGLPDVPDEPGRGAVLEGRAAAGRGPPGVPGAPERARVCEPGVLLSLPCG